MPDKDRIQCSLCAWSTPKRFSWNGKFYNQDSAQRRFLDHIEIRHPEEYSRLQDALLEEFDNGKFKERGERPWLKY